MTAGMLDFIEEYMPIIVGVGFGIGFLLSCVSCLLGYIIGKLQEFFES